MVPLLSIVSILLHMFHHKKCQKLTFVRLVIFYTLNQSVRANRKHSGPCPTSSTPSNRGRGYIGDPPRGERNLPSIVDISFGSTFDSQKLFKTGYNRLKTLEMVAQPSDNGEDGDENDRDDGVKTSFENVEPAPRSSICGYVEHVRNHNTDGNISCDYRDDGRENAAEKQSYFPRDEDDDDGDCFSGLCLGRW